MVDLHTHILPAIDDGAKEVQESLKMIDSLLTQGIDTIILTPHFYSESGNLKKFLQKRKDSFSCLSKNIGERKVKLFLASEVAFPAILWNDYSSFKELKIENTDYILLELPFTNYWKEEFWEGLENFITSTDLIPIIAHIERYPAIRKNPCFIKKLIDLKCLLQVNFSSLIKKDALAQKIIKNRLADFVATDTHNMTLRPPAYLKGLTQVEKLTDKNYVLQLDKNAQALIFNSAIEKNPYIPIRKIWKYYF